MLREALPLGAFSMQRIPFLSLLTVIYLEGPTLLFLFLSLVPVTEMHTFQKECMKLQS